MKRILELSEATYHILVNAGGGNRIPAELANEALFRISNGLSDDEPPLEKKCNRCNATYPLEAGHCPNCQCPEFRLREIAQ